MVFDNFKFNIIVRVIVIALTCLLLGNLASSSLWYLTGILIIALIVIQVISLIKYIEKSNESISEYLKNNKQPVPTPASAPVFEKRAQDIPGHFNDIINNLKKSKIEKDAKYQYIKTIVQHVGIGIITFNKEGDIQIINSAAKRLFRITTIKNISELKKISETLVDSFNNLKTGGRDLIKIIHSDETIQLAVFAIELTLQDEEFKLISLQNIQSELEENEMEAWQKLVRVLTHEIMNSVTPVSSLATTIEEDLKLHIENNEDHTQLTTEELSDLHLAVKTIQKRSEGLIRFVTDFRSLTHIPKTKFNEVEVKDLFEHIDLLMRHEINEHQIAFESKIEPVDLKIKIDQELIEQVLINLIKNAVQALEDEEDRKILLRAYRNDPKHVFISVKDNGPGIDEEAQSKIFIPFFTTKKHGSGIGLSLSKQIMRQHLGSIAVKSKVDEGTEFVMRF